MKNISLKNILNESNTSLELYLVKDGSHDVYKLEILNNLRDELYNVRLNFKSGKSIDSTFDFSKDKDGKSSVKLGGDFYTDKNKAKSKSIEYIDGEIKRIETQASIDKSRWEKIKNNVKSL